MYLICYFLIIIQFFRYNLIVNNETVLKDVILNPGEINTVLLHQNADNIVIIYIRVICNNSQNLVR